ncbi:MAG: hypothetical protein II184_07805, partial [Clostridia bacterium]|nr:hypothetical protein [Clostridia bacterium]
MKRVFLLVLLVPVLLLSGCITSNVGAPTAVPLNTSGNVAVFTPDQGATPGGVVNTLPGTSGSEVTPIPRTPQPTDAPVKG